MRPWSLCGKYLILLERGCKSSGCGLKACASTAPVLFQCCSNTFPVLFQYCTSTTPILFQYCSSTVAVMLQYCFSGVPRLFLYSTSIAPVLFQCCHNTHSSFEYEGAAEWSVAETLSLDRRLMAQPAESTCPQKTLGATTNIFRFDPATWNVFAQVLTHV